MGKNCDCCGCKHCDRKIEKIIVRAIQDGHSIIHEENIGGKTIKDIVNGISVGLPAFYFEAFEGNDGSVYNEFDLEIISSEKIGQYHADGCSKMQQLPQCNPCLFYNYPYDIEENLLFKENRKTALKKTTVSIAYSCDYECLKVSLNSIFDETVSSDGGYFTIIANRTSDYNFLNSSYTTIDNWIAYQYTKTGEIGSGDFYYDVPCCDDFPKKTLMPKSYSACIKQAVDPFKIFPPVICDENNADYVSLFTNIDLCLPPRLLNGEGLPIGCPKIEALSSSQVAEPLNGKWSYYPDIKQVLRPIKSEDIEIEIEIVYSQSQNNFCYNKFSFNGSNYDLKQAIVNCGSNNNLNCNIDLSNILQQDIFTTENIYNYNFQIQGNSSHNPRGYCRRYDNKFALRTNMLGFRGEYKDILSSYIYSKTQSCINNSGMLVSCNPCTFAEVSYLLCKQLEDLLYSYFDFYIDFYMNIKFENNQIHMLLDIYQYSDVFYMLENETLPISQACLPDLSAPPVGGSGDIFKDKKIITYSPFFYRYKKEAIFNNADQLFLPHRLDVVGVAPNIFDLQDHIMVNFYE